MLGKHSWSYPYLLFLFLLVILPLIVIILYAFDILPYHRFSLRNLDLFISQSEAVNTFIYSFGVAIFNTVLCLLLGYPAAYIMATRAFKVPTIMVVLFILPMWINCLLRTIAMVQLFDFLRFPLGEGALLFGICYDFLPFMIYPIYTTILKIDPSLIEASRDLGATALETLYKVVFPLSLPGVYSGIIMVFMPTVSTFAIAELLTHNKIKLFGSLIQESINSGVMLNYGAMLSLLMLFFICLTGLLKKDETGVSRY